MQKLPDTGFLSTMLANLPDVAYSPRTGLAEPSAEHGNVTWLLNELDSLVLTSGPSYLVVLDHQITMIMTGDNTILTSPTCDSPISP